jgi:hypothetical protein
MRPRGLHEHLSTPLACDRVHPDENLGVPNVFAPAAFKMPFVQSILPIRTHVSRCGRMSRSWVNGLGGTTAS